MIIAQVNVNSIVFPEPRGPLGDADFRFSSPHRLMSQLTFQPKDFAQRARMFVLPGTSISSKNCLRKTFLLCHFVLFAQLNVFMLFAAH